MVLPQIVPVSLLTDRTASVTRFGGGIELPLLVRSDCWDRRLVLRSNGTRLPPVGSALPAARRVCIVSWYPWGSPPSGFATRRPTSSGTSLAQIPWVQSVVLMGCRCSWPCSQSFAFWLLLSRSLRSYLCTSSLRLRRRRTSAGRMPGIVFSIVQSRHDRNRGVTVLLQKTRDPACWWLIDSCKNCRSRVCPGKQIPSFLRNPPSAEGRVHRRQC